MPHVSGEDGVVPRIWWYEFRNALLMNERRGRISSQQVAKTLAASSALKIKIDESHDELQILGFCRRFNLTVYDAAYLEVAFRRSLPLTTATLDYRLRKAADVIGIVTVHHKTEVAEGLSRNPGHQNHAGPNTPNLSLIHISEPTRPY